MSVFHHGSTRIDPEALRVITYPDRDEPMVTVPLDGASTAFIEITDPADGRALAQKLLEGSAVLEDEIVARAGDEQ